MLPGELLRQRRTQGKAMDTLADTAARFWLAKWNGRAIDVRSELVYRIVTSNLGGQCTHTITNCQYLICVSTKKPLPAALLLGELLHPFLLPLLHLLRREVLLARGDRPRIPFRVGEGPATISP